MNMNTPDFTQLAQRLQVLEDKEAIRSTLIRGWRALDFKDWDGWIAHWAEDAEFEFGPWGVLKGRQAIRKKVVAAETPYAAMEHQLLNMDFEVAGDQASGIGFMWFIGIADSQKPDEIISMGGPYDWEFVRETEGWKIRRIKLGVWWSQGEDSISAFKQ